MSLSGDLTNAYLDGLEFVRDARVLRGRLPLARMERLATQLLDVSGTLECTLKGEQDRDGSRFLLIEVSGNVSVCCQRCLGAMQLPLQIESRLRLMAPGEPWPDEELEDDESDAVEAGREMAVLPLVEEEVLLAMPLAPRHGRCEPPAAMDMDRAPSAFAVLAQLKKH